MVSLEFLDLSKNTLSGVIPKSLEALVHLKYFNVFYNKLTEEIFYRGPFVNFSSQLFMENGELCGAQSLHFPKCKAKEGRSQKTITYIIMVLKYILPVIVATIQSILALAFLCILKSRKYKLLKKSEMDQSMAWWKRISYYEIQEATNRFSESNLLGIRSFGKVFKGVLSGGMNVAIKVFHLEFEEAFRSFDAKCEILCNVRHRNLTKIISSCSSMDFKALVLSYMSNGSLEKWLHSEHHGLSMIQRLNIMIDVAEAIEYPHHGGSVPIVHCDLKPSNILLDEYMVDHVATP
ncbi:receptor kinase-like protein Xa21 [Arachis ipaensis]|nr:receptor kinase-like protein Xa21 [Arachis ipaensis]